MVSLALLLVGVLTVAYLIFKVWQSSAQSRSQKQIWSRIPNCPGENWLLGHVLHLARTATPWHVLVDWKAQSKGPLVRFRILNQRAVIVDDPHAIRRLFQTHFKAYPKDTAFSYGTFLPILGTGLVTSDGAQWQQQRLLMAPALRVDLLDVVLPIAQRALARLTPKLEAVRGSGQSMDMASEMRHLTLQVIGEAIMQLQPKECDEVLAQTYLPIMEECNKRVIHRWRMYVPTPSWFQQEQRLMKLNSFLKTTLRRRWKTFQHTNSHSGDLLDKMIAPLKEKGEALTGNVMEQMCYEIKTFLLAGHETSASMLAWALYELLCHPDCLQKVRAEADVLFKEEKPGRKHVEEMEYTLAVLKETLRKYSIVPVVCRELTLESDDLCGYTIFKGTKIIISIKGVHGQYQNPEAFDPDRFLPGGEYECFDDEIRPFMFLPFIQGPRNCLGQYFALLESRYVLAYLIKYYNFTLADGKPVIPGDAIPEAPEDGLNLLIH